MNGGTVASTASVGNIPIAWTVQSLDPRFDEPLLLRKLANTRQDVRNLVVLGMRPDLPADKRELTHNAERSARAEVKLRIKALRYCREQQRGQQ